MSHPSKDVLSPEKQALLVLRKMRAKLEEMERARTEPVAIVGLGCRFPGGAVDGDSFWRVLAGGVDAVTEIPRDRFDIDAFYDPNPDSRGTIYTRRAGFVDGVDRFDAPFFGISRREALSLDPQQRMLLEVSWEALENAGHPPDALHGTKTGVFMGISSGDYGQLQMQRRNHTDLDLYFGTGIAPSAVAGRLSYVLGLVGPSIAVDTACSASLVAVHLACQSLRAGECRAALAGGVNLNILPEIFISLCTARMLAPDGRCKAFDAAADGYVRGEGCGVVVLKRLSDALSDGDRVLALIRGTVVNQDGRSGGFTAPSELSQEELLRDAVARAGISPLDVDYVEAHGTGTPLGDPIEMQALAAVLCAGRPLDRPLAVGSVKTNIGHLEAAAGIAGLIKVVLALQHRTIPPHLHLKTLNPLLALNGAPVVVPTAALQWPSDGRPRLAGVSSFGFTGTNAHAILEEAPARAAAVADRDRPRHILTLSAKSEAALEGLAGRFEAHLREAAADSLADVSFTANTGRTHFAHRLAVTGNSIEEVRAGLAAWRAGEARSGVHRSGGAAPGPSEIAFLFTGQGSQYAGMGRQLYETQPAFRRAMERCDELLRPHLSDPILSVIYPETSTSALLDRTGCTQPALFALEYALAELWLSWGVEPTFVMGHSLGEYVAACVAGLFSLEDALALVAARGRLMQSLPDDGEMIAVLAEESHVVRALCPDEATVSIAAANGPENVVISGGRTAVRAVRDRLEAAGVRTERLSVSHAFHSPLMDPILDEFARLARQVTFTTPRIGIVSNLTGDLISPSEISTPEYWCRHLRDTVRFATGLQTLYAHGVRTFVEIGPSPTLVAMGRRTISDEGASWLPSLRKGRDDWTQMLDTLGHLYVSRVAIDWKRFDAGHPRQKVTLPTYPFERLSYWVDAPLPDRGAMRVESQSPAPPSPAPGELEYELVWEDERAPAPSREERPFDRCVIFADARGLGAEFARQSRQNGVRAIAVTAGRQYRRAEGSIEIDPFDADHYRRALDDIAPDGDLASTGFVYLWAADESVPGNASRPLDDPEQTGGCEGLLRLLQALTGSHGRPPRLWVATRGAQPIGGAAVSIAGAAIWGFGRVLALEHPEMWGGLVDLQPGTCEEEAHALWNTVSSCSEDQVAVRGGRRFVPRLVRREVGTIGGAKLFSADATYLITGGLGGLGLKVATWMADRGVRHLVLVSRSGLPDRETWDAVEPSDGCAARIHAIRELEERGVDVAIVRADVADRARMAALVDQLRASPHPLRGIVHAAGVSRPGLIRDLDVETLRSVLRPKLAGGWILHELTADLPLDAFVLFSSISSVWGSKGLAHYAAANHFLDVLAHHRHALGLPALSLNWGPWAGGGMASDDDLRTLAAVGIEPLAPDAALPALDHLLATGCVQSAVARVDWNVFKALYGATGRRRLLEKIVSHVEPEGTASEMPDLLRRMVEAPKADRMRLLRAALQGEVAAVLQDEVVCNQPLAALGLDSLMALEIRNRIQRAFGVTVPVVSFLNGADVNALAASILRDLEARELDIASDEERRSSPSTAPLSSAQRRIWFFEQLRPDTGTFNDQLVVRLKGSLDVPSLERTFATIVARHDVLRTTIVAGDDGPVQTVAPSHDQPALEVVDLASMSDSGEHARRLVDGNLRERFDLQRGPLFRARLYRVSATEHVLAYAIHHVINDGWSLRVFIDEVCHWYTAAVTGAPGLLPALPVQYAVLARRQQQALSGDVYGADLAYWRERLANAPGTTELPTDYPRMDDITPVGASRSRLLDRALGGRLRDLARGQGATLFMTLLAAFKCLLSRLTGQADLVVGSPVSVRSAEAEPLIGCFINQLALRTDLSDDPTFFEVLRRVRETALGAYAHQEVPFEKIVETLKPARDPNRPPFFQILFNMLVAPPSRIELPGVVAEVESTADDWARFDLTMYVFERDDTLGLHLVYNANLYTDATAGTVIETFEYLLEQIAADPDQPVSTYSLLTSAEQDSMVGVFSGKLE